MKKRSEKPGWLKKQAQEKVREKAELDLQTPYLTLLPHMEEGFHSGYQPKPGIVSDTNQKPHEWLENVAKYMQTQGEDVGYSIPDVLAGEQQMRRLMRLSHDKAIRHQEMINWRGILALLLLWDGWEKDSTWPVITCEDALLAAAPQRGESFRHTVGAALSRERAAQGLRIFAIARQSDQKPDKRPLCMLSQAVIVMPAANPGDLSGFLPPKVRWYDRARKRFLDPCDYLEEEDRTRLVLQLRLLQHLNEKEEAESFLYSPKAQLCSPLERFIDDLQGFRNTWREQLAMREEGAVRGLYTRALAVFGLLHGAAGMEIPGLSEARGRMEAKALTQNLLTRHLVPPGAALPDLAAESAQIQYLYEGVPFARFSENWLLEPTNTPGEEDAITALAREVSLLNDFSGKWNAFFARRFAELYSAMKNRVGASSAVISLLGEWQRRHAAYPMQRDRSITLYYPIEGHPRTLNLLFEDLLGMEDTVGISDAFSDSLLLITDAAQPPFHDLELCEACRVQGNPPGTPEQYVLPPLSPWLSAWLMDQAEKEDPFAARLSTKSLSFVRDEKSGAIRASFRVVCRRHGQDAVLTHAITFCRTYPEGGGPGQIASISAGQLPYVVAWPNVRLARDIWRQYFVYAHRPEAVDVWVRQGDAWAQGALRQAVDVNAKGQTRRRAWQTASAERYPSYVVLKKGSVTLGALVNDAPRVMLKHEPPAVAAIDFGSIATTVMLRQDDKVQPAAFPRCLHGALLHAKPEDEQYLPDELLPMDALLPRAEGGQGRERESTFYSVMDMFTDDQKSWRSVLRDGHIYYRQSLSELMRKNENALYYDMKWSDEEYVMQAMRLFLKQVMVQASLSARLCGAPSVSWRVSIPNALPLPRQEAYLEMMRGLSRDTASETGLPLTEGIPSVLFATENQADGLYFRGRNEVNVRSGYVNMDIGGGTTDVSIWLNNAQRATLEASLLLGCRQMFFDSVSTRHLDAFEQDFAQSGERMKTVVRAVAQTLATGNASARGRQKSMFLLDDFFADYDREIWKMMARVRSEGQVSYVESLLLLNVGFLFHICGVMLGRVWQNPETRNHLHRRMEICIAGNGGQLLKAFDNDTRTKLCKLALQALPSGHPVRELLLVQSRHPKQEVAIGLLSDEQSMRSAVQGGGGWREQQDAPVDIQQHQEVMREFPLRFFTAFPQAAERLLAPVFETKEKAFSQSVRLTTSASMELDTVLDNEFFGGSEDDFTAYVRCFSAMKRLWRV